MQWFYATGGQQQGPVDEAQLTQLRGAGTIGEETLVWREGMANWRPYREAVAASAASSPLMAPPVAGGVLCAECGKAFPPEEVVRLAEAFVCAACKPIRLQKMSEGVTDSTAEQIRKDHIKHEASIKSVGVLYFLSGTFLGFAGIVGLASGEGPGIGGGILLLALSAGLFMVGVGLRRLRGWARVASGVLAGIGLLGFPLGTLINGYILYLLFSAKGKTIFSEDYQRVIAQTPHIKYRTSMVVWILAGLVLVLFLVGVFGLILSRGR